MVGINMNSATVAVGPGIAVIMTKTIVNESITPKKVSLRVLLLVFIYFPPVLVLYDFIVK